MNNKYIKFMFSLSILIGGMCLASFAEAGFTKGTTVLFKGQFTPIETIQKGQHIWGQHEKTGKVWVYQVEETISEKSGTLIQLTMGSDLIEVSPEHSFKVIGKGWVAAVSLEMGDSLVTASKQKVLVTKLDKKKYSFQLYNLEIREAHTYYVSKSRVLTHNGKLDSLRDHFEDEEFVIENIGTGGHVISANMSGENALMELEYYTKSNIFVIKNISRRPEDDTLIGAGKPEELGFYANDMLAYGMAKMKRKLIKENIGTEMLIKEIRGTDIINEGTKKFLNNKLTRSLIKKNPKWSGKLANTVPLGKMVTRFLSDYTDGGEISSAHVYMKGKQGYNAGLRLKNCVKFTGFKSKKT